VNKRGRRRAALSPPRPRAGLTGLSAGTATLAPEPGGLAEALTARASTFRSWIYKAGSWQLDQTVSVPVPYGSSS
jgi:hypothetical protein